MLTNVPNSDILLWLIDARKLADDQLAHCICWLNPEELARYRRFIRPQRQRQFLIGRCLLRAALSKLLKLAPTDISLTESAANAPLLHCSPSTPFFSISHSGPWVICAVSPHCVVGIDIEMKNPDRDLDAIAAHAFDETEVEQLSKLIGDERLKYFYELWSHKEAYYKLLSNVDSNKDSNKDSKNKVESGGHCIALTHSELSVVLCSQDVLRVPPVLVEVNFSTLISV